MADTQPLIAVANAGSSSLKFALYAVGAGGTLVLQLRGAVEELDRAPVFHARDAAGRTVAEQRWTDALGHDAALAQAITAVQALLPGMHLIGVGHRVVHGGAAHDQAVLVTPALMAELEQLIPLAPLHEPHNLAPIRLAWQRLPGVPQVACFDTAFHRSNPAIAQMFALPQELHDAGVRRYGFHGLSYEYIAGRLAELAPDAAAGRVVVLHLGNGASACALQGGRSVASSMGFTAVDGLPMGTRSGNLDPGVLLYLVQQRGMSVADIHDLIYKRSGLLGVSGISSDMRVLLHSDAPRAALAVDLFVYRVVREIGSLAAALGGLDALVFTAGIGEHAAPVRARVLAQLGWLGLVPDAAANAAHAPCITQAGSRASAWVLPTDEELMIARHTLALLEHTA
ncbi:acetate/propionate family kinase [Pseudorhodoferax soli]|uniref:Acetate kinase n=1 Tax=Pseudorhodoferax soli TaxID=545864 RepID=A0A368XJ99_9BURK|nr:acetate/propionate family kinase [Pseudorhodoferax soli]RCW68111.1 acetate kinase [Pseudorhodoferax soli]